MKKTRKKQASKQNALIVALLSTVGAMAVGYAALATTLTINGTATVEAEWDVKITGITASGDGKDTEGNPKFTDTTATFDAILGKPGDIRSYEITVKNNGSIDAKLSSIVLNPNGDTTGCEDITYTVDAAPAADSTLAAGATTTVKISAKFNDVDELPEGTCKKTITGTLNYVQAE